MPYTCRLAAAAISKTRYRDPVELSEQEEQSRQGAARRETIFRRAFPH
jgi:hypothetical protein